MGMWLRVSIVACVLALSSSCSHPVQQASAPVSAPQLQPDDVWTYELVNLWQGGVIEQQRVTVVSADAEMAYVRLESQRVAEERPNVRTVRVDLRTLTEINPFKPTYVFLDFPLHPGKTWNFTYETRSRATANGKVDGSGKVLGWETVAVPAGTFHALRVELKERGLVQAGDGVFPGYSYQTIWYVPGVKRFVRYEREVRNPFNKRESYEGTVMKSFVVK